MKKYLLFAFLLVSMSGLRAQVLSIRPDSATQGQTLRTYITMNTGAISYASPPMTYMDIYLQQGATTIYCDPSFYPWTNVYPCMFYLCDSLYADFAIPVSAPSGLYNVVVYTYQFDPWSGTFNPVYHDLPNGFYIGPFTGIENSFSENDLAVFYDQNVLNVQFEARRNEWITLYVHDMAGREVYMEKIFNTSGRMELHPGIRDEGIYFVTLLNDAGEKTASMIRVRKE